MRVRKAGELPKIEMWDIPEIMNHLKCDEMKARKIMDSYHHENGGYGPVEKALMLDYIERKQIEERERETRHQSDLANVEISATLKEQVKTLKEQVKTLNNQVEVLRESAAASSMEARSARHWALFASILLIVATIVASLIPSILSCH